MEENHQTDDQSNATKTGGYDLGSFEFLKAGWWVWHIIAIAGIFYLGYLYGVSM